VTEVHSVISSCPSEQTDEGSIGRLSTALDRWEGGGGPPVVVSGFWEFRRRQVNLFCVVCWVKALSHRFRARCGFLVSVVTCRKWAG